MNKTIAISGCNGFIGKKLTAFFLSKGYIVVGLDIIQTNFFDSFNGFHFVFLDFDQELVNKLSSFKIDVFYHLAWCGVSSLDKNNYEKQFLNIDLTFKILELCLKTKVKKIVIPGSMSEFSRSKKEIRGAEKESPLDLYAATKVAIRKLSYYYCKKNGLDLNWLLITSVYGPNRNDSNLITSTIKSLLDNQIVKTTKLEQRWDYIYIDDLIQAMFLIGLYGKKNQIYPVGSGQPKPLSYFVKYIAQLLNREHLLKIGALPYKNKFVDNSIPDVSKLSKLGYKPLHSFEQEIQNIISDYRKQ